jgi:acyl-CoA thioester hydrolase
LKNPLAVERIPIRYADLDPYGHFSHAVYLSFFEPARTAYLRALSKNLGLGSLETGDFPGVRYIIAEATVHYKDPVYLDDPCYSAASVRSAGEQYFVMDYELCTGESVDEGRTVADGTTARVFNDPKIRSIRRCPEWFLSAVATLKGCPEESFVPKGKGR